MEGDFGGVVGVAEVGKPEPAHAVGTPGTQDGVGCLGVGEVAGRAEDALFEDIGIGTTAQSFKIVIGFEDEQVGVAHDVEHDGGDFASVGDDADAATTGREQVAAG